MPDASSEQCQESCRKCISCRWIVAVLVAVIGGVGLFATIRDQGGHDSIAGPPVLKANAKDLSKTVVTPHLETPIEPGKNVLWCSTFQLVWNQMCRDAGGDLHIENEPPMVAVLNKKAATEADVDMSSCLVMSGRIEDGVVAKIRKELDRKFRGQADPDLLNAVEPRLPKLPGYLAYAYLFRQLPFEYRFRRLDDPLDFGTSQVTSFGLRKMGEKPSDDRIARQMTVLDYKNADDFVIELKPKDTDERIVLAKLAPAATLQKTIEMVKARAASSTIEEWHKMFSPGESLIVPVFSFDVLQEYEDLYSKSITTDGPLKEMFVVLAMQDIRFQLDERGAVLKSDAAKAGAKCAESRSPRQFIFDKPFLILLERRGAKQPYFALWVDNAELLVPSTK